MKLTSLTPSRTIAICAVHGHGHRHSGSALFWEDLNNFLLDNHQTRPQPVTNSFITIDRVRYYFRRPGKSSWKWFCFFCKLPTTFFFFFEYFCLLTLSKKRYFPNNIRNYFSDEITQFDICYNETMLYSKMFLIGNSVFQIYC